jgi:hypothetical protein
MLQRILARFCALPGANQSYLVSRHDGLVAAVGKRNRVPDLELANKLILALLDIETATGVSDGLELWFEGDDHLLLSRIDEDEYIVISGKGKRIARWRHAIENDLELLHAIN